jgi:hypothetical protein
VLLKKGGAYQMRWWNREVSRLVIHLFVVRFAQEYQVGVIIPFLGWHGVIITTSERLLPSDNMHFVTDDRWEIGRVNNEIILADRTLAARTSPEDFVCFK